MILMHLGESQTSLDVTDGEGHKRFNGVIKGVEKVSTGMFYHLHPLSCINFMNTSLKDNSKHVKGNPMRFFLKMV